MQQIRVILTVTVCSLILGACATYAGQTSYQDLTYKPEPVGCMKKVCRA